MFEGARHVGLRVATLKAQGRSGVTVDDFKADPEIKAALDLLDDQQASLQAGYQDLLHKQARQRAAFKALTDTLAAEIATRQAKTTTRLHLGNKSVADMQQLAGEVTALQNRVDTKRALKVSASPDKFRQDVLSAMNKEIAKPETAIRQAQEAGIETHLLNARNLQRCLTKAQKLNGDLLSIEATVGIAQKLKQPRLLSSVQARSAKAAKDVVDLVKPIEVAAGQHLPPGALQGDALKARKLVDTLIKERNKAVKHGAKLKKARLS